MRDAMSLIFASIVALENFRSLGAGLPGAHEAATTVKIKLKQRMFILNRLHKLNDLFIANCQNFLRLKTGFKGGKMAESDDWQQRSFFSFQGLPLTER